jgi:hypothetical protein
VHYYQTVLTVLVPDSRLVLDNNNQLKRNDLLLLVVDRKLVVEAGILHPLHPTQVEKYFSNHH